uniref:Indole diterpene prenyltransferase nodD1 n=1 Tax=Hypoxylon pulicicidum TaxID=1243767 RepID=NODD1_HYPPI|nr:RecName: Full=Indole diterpene prenyltransferase nodD1; AltName: Full=Nodulisporic acid biosynthesis cluster protein D1 [Hypoxylon pulicicidum]AUM60056.1 indole diterpene biosynthesis protein [Hypoxylon pulicicidum]
MDAASTLTHAPVSQPWQSLAQGLGFVNEHEGYWWSKLGPPLGKMMNWARYSTSEQYRVLAFLYKYLLPACGPKPGDDGELFWKVFISYDYTPIQLSLNFHNGKMTLRTANIPISDKSGTADDPINQQASVDAIIRQERVLPSQDLRWFNHFASQYFFDKDTAASLKTKVDKLRVQQGVQCMLSHDFPERDVQCKVAFCPLWKAVATGLSNKEIIWDSILGLGDDIIPYKRALAVLEQYTSSENAAKAGVRPVFFAFDTVLKDNYKSSRIKIYYLTTRTAFNSMVDIYTLGGLLKGPDIQKGVEALEVLWKAVLNVPEGWPDDKDLPMNPHRCAAVIFNFELWPGAEFPSPKAYLPAHYYGRPDLEIADGMDYFFKQQGLDGVYGSYKENYLKCLSEVRTHRTNSQPSTMIFLFHSKGPMPTLRCTTSPSYL